MRAVRLPIFLACLFVSQAAQSQIYNPQGNILGPRGPPRHPRLRKSSLCVRGSMPIDAIIYLLLVAILLKHGVKMHAPKGANGT
jgi:hypothetical protein